MANVKRNKRKNTLTGPQLDLQPVKPKTDNQAKFFERYDSGKSQLVTGYPGTGKTFLAKYKAFEDVIDPQSDFNKIIIVRSSVPTRDIGFLPGSLAEKNEVYELPYKSICTELFNRGDAYGILKKHGILEFVTTSFIRGITVDRAIIIVDELQNMSTHEASSIITRVGIDCKIIFCGDLLQTDFTKSSDKDIGDFIKILQNMPNEFSVTSFTAEDIVRSNLVKQFILTQANLGLI